MSVITVITQIMVAASAMVIAAAAIGIYHRLRGVTDRVEKHDRTLYGVEGIEQWDGLVARVADHEAELEKGRDKE